MEKTLDYLRKLCATREYCRKDIYAKALKRLGDDERAAGAVATLEKEGYLSESRYAAAFARDKSSIAGWGPAKIRFTLRSKGVPDDVVRAALEQIDGEKAASRLDKVLEVKYKTLKDDPQVRLKLLKFALGRGYDYDDVSSAVNSLLQK